MTKFYEQIRPVMILCYIIGIFPVRNPSVKDGRKLKLCFYMMTYGIIMQGILFTAIIIVTKSKELILYQLATTGTSQILWWYSSNAILTFLKKVEHIKEEINTNLVGENKFNEKSRLIVIIVRVCVINLVVKLWFIQTKQKLWLDESHVFQIMHAVLKFPKIQMPILYVFFCEELIRLFRDIERAFRLCYNNPIHVEKVITL